MFWKDTKSLNHITEYRLVWLLLLFGGRFQHEWNRSAVNRPNVYSLILDRLNCPHPWRPLPDAPKTREVHTRTSEIAGLIVYGNRILKG